MMRVRVCVMALFRSFPSYSGQVRQVLPGFDIPSRSHIPADTPGGRWCTGLRALSSRK